MPTVHAPAAQHLVLDGVDWSSYGRCLRLLNDRPSLRLTYDRGTLEIMNLTYEHESWGHFLGRIVIALTEELGLPIAGGGSTTFRKRKRRRGLESDECYWIANEARVRGKKRLDLRTDPPPDLAIEIDITHSSLNRMSIYADLGIPEIWHLDAQGITFHALGSDGQYTKSERSLAFPSLAPADLARFVALRGQIDENAVIRQFRSWVRERQNQ